MKNKKGLAPLVLMMVLAAMITILTATGLINIGSIFGYDTVYKANWGSACCEKEGAYSVNYQKWLDQQKTFACNYYTDECDVYITEDPNQFGIPRGRYYIDSGSAIGWVSGDMIKLPAGSSIRFSADFGYADNTKINVKTKRFRIIQEESGRDLVTESCVLSSDLRRKTEVTELNEIPFDTCQNYVTDFISVATKIYSYSGQEVVCQSRAVYEIDNLQFKDGSTRKIQGEKISYVDCCPHENNCGEDFQFHDSVERECTYSTECANGGDPYPLTQTSARKFVCQDGQCVADDFSVECTSTAVCIEKYGEGYVCDISTNNFGKCMKSTTPTYCGDGYCDIGETRSNCPEDCELECAEDERLVTTESKENCFIGFPLYSGCETIIEKKCVKDGLDWIKIIVILSIIAILFFFRHQLLALIKIGWKKVLG